MDKSPGSGRDAYPGTPIDQILASINPGDQRKQKIADVRINGKRLGEISDSLRTPQAFEVRPETKYREAFAGAVGAVEAGLEAVEISTVRGDGTPREAPDLLLEAGGGLRVGVEVVRVDETSNTRARLLEVERQLVEDLDANPGWKPGRWITFTIDYVSAAALTKAEWEMLHSELLDFFKSGRVSFLDKGRLESVFAKDSIAGKCSLSVEVDSPSHLALLTFARADEMTPRDGIISAIADKRRKRYDHSQPLWLIVEVADPRGPFRKGLEAARAQRPQIEPFEKVLVHDGYSQVILP